MASDTIQINYSIPTNRIQPGSFALARSVCLSETLDLRGQPPCHVMEKLPMPGRPVSGDYISQEPVADIVHRAMEQALEKAGNTKPAAEAELLLSLKILSLDFKVMVGFAQCLLRGDISVEASVKEASSGNLVWEGKLQGAGRSGTGNLVPEVFSSALDNLLISILSCPGLK